jgi:hypothetical protein
MVIDLGQGMRLIPGCSSAGSAARAGITQSKQIKATATEYFARMTGSYFDGHAKTSVTYREVNTIAYERRISRDFFFGYPGK